jgi:hypothetical protein
MMLDSVSPSTLDREFAVIINRNNNAAIYVANFWPQSTSLIKIPTTTTRIVLSLNAGDTIRPTIYQNLRDNAALNIILSRNHFIINELPPTIPRQV